MDRHDDYMMSKLIENLLKWQKPTETDKKYIEGLLLEASSITPDINDIIRINTIYADIIGKCYLYAMFDYKLNGDK